MKYLCQLFLYNNDEHWTFHLICEIVSLVLCTSTYLTALNFTCPNIAQSLSFVRFFYYSSVTPYLFTCNSFVHSVNFLTSLGESSGDFMNEYDERYHNLQNCCGNFSHCKKLSFMPSIIYPYQNFLFTPCMLRFLKKSFWESR